MANGYDYHAITFSPDGRLFQIEYATKVPAEKEALALGVRCSDGILFAAEKNLASPLLTPSSNARIFWIDTHIVCATVGYRPDCIAAVVTARNEAQRHRDNFGIPITVPQLVSCVSSSFYGMAPMRPYAAALMFGSADPKGPNLYAIEPNSQYYGYRACCFGKGSNLARTELLKTEWSEMTVKEAVPIVGKIIQERHESQSNKKWEIEMMWVCTESNGMPQVVPEEIFKAAQE